MASVRSCVCLLVVLVHLQGTLAKPFFGWMFCDMFCDDEDITSTTSASATPDFFDFMFDCTDCPRSQPVATPTPGQSIAMRLPALPGLTMNVTNSNGAVQFVMDAVSSMSQQTAAPAAAAPATTAAPPANTTTAA